VRRDLDAVVTTEKDSVRFPHRAPSLDVPVLFLRVEIEILRGQDVWENLMRQVCAPPAMRPPELVFA
jgi:tetraacyldisaccharide 4'-kinase